MSRHRDDPIVAIATAAGRGGIGVVRLSFGRWSGEANVAAFVARLCGKAADFRLVPRHATLVAIRDADRAVIDRGIALLFAAPHSYTGDDVLELQVHGGPLVLQMIVARCLAVAAEIVDKSTIPDVMRPAEPGEFTERAFLNDKLDLAQAEAVADLIEAGSEAAVRGAQASLSGAFSQVVEALVADTIELRALVEATLDFPEEEIDFLEQSDARGRLDALRFRLADVLRMATRGALLREGMTVVLVGRPNVGKSSLLNALAEADVAIVTPIPGTTRDRVEQAVRVAGIALHVVDTAGIRAPEDALDDVERIGIERTWEAIARADVVLHVVEARPDGSLVEDDPVDATIVARVPSTAARRTVVNKIDLCATPPREDPFADRIFLSALTGAGVDGLRAELLAIAGWQPTGETGFSARTRHLTALRAAEDHFAVAAAHADHGDRELDLFAEALRQAQVDLSTITGAFSADDLLGEIFGKFCIGK